MLTGRGYWLIATLLFAAAPTILLREIDATRIALALWIWFGLAWFLFALRCSLVRKTIHATWSFDDEAVTDRVVWSGRFAKLKLAITSHFGWPPADVIATIPKPAFGSVEGELRKLGELTAADGILLEFGFQAFGPAVVRLEGVQLEFSDFCGFFSYRMFLRQPLELIVLAPHAHEHAMLGTLKRINALSTYGQHRHLRPGSGSDLLNLRDYQPGDPPKSIAWKISAKRNRLITKEYESEVPVRCTAFIDISNSARMGPVGESLLSRSGRLVVPLAQKLIAGKDQIGLCLFDEQRVITLPPRAAHWQVTRMQHSILAAAKLPVKPVPCSVELIAEPLSQLCHRIYPELVTRSINAPEPWYRKIKLVSFRGIMGLWSLAIMIGIITGALMTGEAPKLIAVLPAAYLIGAAVLAWLIIPSSKATHTSLPKIKQAIAVVAALKKLGPGGISLLTKDERLFSVHAQELLNEHQVEYDRPMYDERGNSLLVSPGKIKVLAGALIRAIAHCQDNELFVLFVDLIDQADHRQPLMQAIRVAISRHHQVMVVVSWPDDVPVPKSDPSFEGREMQLGDLSLRVDNLTYTTFLLKELSMKEHYHRLTSVREELKRMGVPMLLVNETTTRGEILARIERLRAARTAARI